MEFFLYKLKLLTAETYPKFIRIDQFLSVIAQTNTQTERQILNCSMATKLINVPIWKGALLNNKSMDKYGIICSKDIVK